MKVLGGVCAGPGGTAAGIVVVVGVWAAVVVGRLGPFAAAVLRVVGGVFGAPGAVGVRSLTWAFGRGWDAVESIVWAAASLLVHVRLACVFSHWHGG